MNNTQQCQNCGTQHRQLATTTNEWDEEVDLCQECLEESFEETI